MGDEECSALVNLQVSVFLNSDNVIISLTRKAIMYVNTDMFALPVLVGEKALMREKNLVFYTRIQIVPATHSDKYYHGSQLQSVTI